MAAYSGVGSFPSWMTVSGNGASDSTVSSENIPVTVGVDYSFQVVASFDALNNSGIQLNLVWYNSSNEVISTVTATSGSMTGGTPYTISTASTAAPSGTVYAIAQIILLNNPVATNLLNVYQAQVNNAYSQAVNINYAFTWNFWPWTASGGGDALIAWASNPLLTNDNDSLVIDGIIEIMGGAQGVQCTLPELLDSNGQGPVYRILAPPSLNTAAYGYEPSYDLNAPQPTQDVVASMLLDGERPFGSRSSNRTMTLPIMIFGTLAGGMNQVLKAREYLMQVIDQQIFQIKWTPADTGLATIFDCFRALPSTPLYGFNYSAGGSATDSTIGKPNYPIAMITLSIQAMPFGRSDIDGVQTLAFNSPLTNGISPYTVSPVTIDQFTGSQYSAPNIASPVVTEIATAIPPLPTLIGYGDSTGAGSGTPMTFTSTEAFTGPGVIAFYYNTGNLTAQTISISDNSGKGLTYTQEAAATSAAGQGWLFQAPVAAGVTIPSGTTWSSYSSNGHYGFCEAAWIQGATGIAATTTWTSSAPGTAVGPVTATYTPGTTDANLVFFGLNSGSPTLTGISGVWDELLYNTTTMTGGLWYGAGFTSAPVFGATMNGSWDAVVIMADIEVASNFSMTTTTAAPAGDTLVALIQASDNVVTGVTDSAGNSYSLASMQATGGSSSAYDTLVAAAAPTAWWKLTDAKGSSTAADSSGNGWTGTATSVTFGNSNAPLYGSDTTASFNGTSSKITTSYPASGLTALSLECWVNYNATGGDNCRLIGTANPGGTQGGFGLFATGGTVYFDIGNGTTNVRQDGTPSGGIQANTWYHFVATYDGAVTNLYVNGVAIGTSQSLTGTIPAGTSDVEISGLLNIYHNGLMAEAAVYNYALDASEIVSHYAAGETFMYAYTANATASLPSGGTITVSQTEQANFSASAYSMNGAWSAGSLASVNGTSSTFSGSYAVAPYNTVLSVQSGLGSAGGTPTGFHNVATPSGNGLSASLNYKVQGLQQTSMAYSVSSLPDPYAIQLLLLVPVNQYWVQDNTSAPSTFSGNSVRWSAPQPFSIPYPAATYTGTLPSPVSIVGCTALSVMFGQSYDTQWPSDPKFISNVTLSWTLTDNNGNTLNFSCAYKNVTFGSVATTAKWTQMNAYIPQGKNFNYNAVSGYSVRISNWSGSGHTGYIRMHCWLNNITANAQTQANGISPRGTVYNLFALPGSARSPVSVQCQLPQQANVTQEITSPATGTWIVPAGVYSVQAEAWAGGGAGASTNLSRNISAGGGGGGEYAQEPALAVTPGQKIPWSIGAAGSPAQLVDTVVQYTSRGLGHWTCPAGVYSVLAECWGGGAAGAAGSGGGGGGAYAAANVPVTPGATYPVWCGGGGAAQTGKAEATTAARTGADSWFAPPGETSTAASMAYFYAPGGSTSTVGSSSGGAGGSLGTISPATQMYLAGYSNPGTVTTVGINPASYTQPGIPAGANALLIVSVPAATTMSVSDTAGNTWELIGTSSNTGAVSYIYMMENSKKALTYTSRVNVTQGTSQTLNAGLYYLPWTVGVDGTPTTAAGTGTAPSITSGTPSYSGELNVTFFTDTGANTTTTPSGWTKVGASLGNHSYMNAYAIKNSTSSAVTCTSAYAASETWSAISINFLTVRTYPGGHGGSSPGPSGGGGGGAAGATGPGGIGGNSQPYTASVGNGWQSGGAGGTGVGQGGSGGAGANTPGFPGAGVQPGGGGGGGYQSLALFTAANPSNATAGSPSSNFLGGNGGAGMVQLTYAIGNGQPVNGGNTTFGSSATTGTVVQAYGGQSAASNSAAGGLGGAGSNNTIHNNGGAGGLNTTGGTVLSLVGESIFTGTQSPNFTPVGTGVIPAGYSAICTVSYAATCSVGLFDPDVPNNGSWSFEGTSGASGYYSSTFVTAPLTVPMYADNVYMTSSVSQPYTISLVAAPNVTGQDSFSTSSGTSAAPSIGTATQSQANDIQYVVFTNANASTTSTPAGWNAIPPVTGGGAPYANIFWRMSPGQPGSTCTSAYAASESWGATSVTYKTSGVMGSYMASPSVTTMFDTLASATGTTAGFTTSASSASCAQGTAVALVCATAPVGDLTVTDSAGNVYLKQVGQQAGTSQNGVVAYAFVADIQYPITTSTTLTLSTATAQQYGVLWYASPWLATGVTTGNLSSGHGTGTAFSGQFGIGDMSSVEIELGVVLSDTSTTVEGLTQLRTWFNAASTNTLSAGTMNMAAYVMENQGGGTGTAGSGDIFSGSLTASANWATLCVPLVMINQQAAVAKMDWRTGTTPGASTSWATEASISANGMIVVIGQAGSGSGVTAGPSAISDASGNVYTIQKTTILPSGGGVMFMATAPVTQALAAGTTGSYFWGNASAAPNYWVSTYWVPNATSVDTAGVSAVTGSGTSVTGSYTPADPNDMVIAFAANNALTNMSSTINAPWNYLDANFQNYLHGTLQAAQATDETALQFSESISSASWGLQLLGLQMNLAGTGGGAAGGPANEGYPGVWEYGAPGYAGGGKGGVGAAPPAQGGNGAALPGGGGGGALGSSAGAQEGGQGAAGALRLTYQPPLQTFNTLIVHSLGMNTDPNVNPLCPIPITDVPNNTEYEVPSVNGLLPATFSSTYTVLLAAYTWNSATSSSPRQITVTVNQYEYPGGPNVSVQCSRAITPATDSVNGLLDMGEVTLPIKDYIKYNDQSYFTVSINDTDTGDRFMDVIFLDTTGQTTLINIGPGEAGYDTYVNYFIDEATPDRDLGYIGATFQDRQHQVSVMEYAEVSGGALYITQGDNLFMVYSTSGAPNLSVVYSPRWYLDRSVLS